MTVSEGYRMGNFRGDENILLIKQQQSSKGKKEAGREGGGGMYAHTGQGRTGQDRRDVDSTERAMNDNAN
jgi:hypothetical protein